MAFELPSLNYTYDALEPHFDARTMEIHYSKHHNTYITNANAALCRGTDYESSSICELVEGISGLPDSLKTAVRNNAGGHANHSFSELSTRAEVNPSVNWRLLSTQLRRSFDAFKASFAKAADVLGFGSGWAWLIVTTSWESCSQLHTKPRQPSHERNC